MQEVERRRLHNILARIIEWDAATDENLMIDAMFEIAVSIARSRAIKDKPRKDRAELLRFLDEHAPKVYDPFAGGGFIPVEVQRLGLSAEASDLNPVSVLINKAVSQLPAKFLNLPPINPQSAPLDNSLRNQFNGNTSWIGLAGLIEDITFYGKWIREQTHRKIGHHFPKVQIDRGRSVEVATWLWARTIPCPNPACRIKMPLVSTFNIWQKKNHKRWVKPIVSDDAQRVTFQVQDHSEGVPSTGTASRKGVICVACGATAKLDYAREQGQQGLMGAQLLSIIADDDGDRVFLSPQMDHEQAADECHPDWIPNGKLPEKARSISPQIYGFEDWHSLFTSRQKVMLTTLCDLISEVRVSIAAKRDDHYADAVCTYLTLAIGKMANSGNAFTIWGPKGHGVQNMFSRQGIGMTWDFPETNPFSEMGKNWDGQVESIIKVLRRLPSNRKPANVYQADATIRHDTKGSVVYITDPPYYDNIHYADSSDFFYVWFRRILRENHPELFAGILTPKDSELVANRFRSKSPELFFEHSLFETFKNFRQNCSGQYPSAVFYAYKQKSTGKRADARKGWETMLTSLLDGGFQIEATWPIRTEQTSALKTGINALSTSVVIVIRPRAEDSPAVTRQGFLHELETELPNALDRLTRDGHIAPPDLPQSAIGPGMEIYSRYSRVETIAGEPVTVGQALDEINRVIREYFDREEGELDVPTRFCIDWLKAHRYLTAPFGDADNIARAQNLSVNEIVDTHGLVNAENGTVQLNTISTYDPKRRYPANAEITAWEGCMRMSYHLDTSNEDGKGVVGLRRSRQTHGRKPRLRRTPRTHPLQPLRQSKPTAQRLYLQPASLGMAKHFRRGPKTGKTHARLNRGSVRICQNAIDKLARQISLLSKPLIV